MVSGIKSHDMVEFNIVDLICCFSLEPLADQVKLGIANLQFHCVKYRSESGVCNEARVALVFVLKEWLYQQSLMFHLNTNSLHYSI